METCPYCLSSNVWWFSRNQNRKVCKNCKATFTIWNVKRRRVNDAVIKELKKEILLKNNKLEKIHKAIQIYIDSLSMSHTQIAKRIGIKTQSVVGIYNGELSDVDNLFKILKIHYEEKLANKYVAVDHDYVRRCVDSYNMPILSVSRLLDVNNSSLFDMYEWKIKKCKKEMYEKIKEFKLSDYIGTEKENDMLIARRRYIVPYNITDVRRKIDSHWLPMSQVWRILWFWEKRIYQIYDWMRHRITKKTLLKIKSKLELQIDFYKLLVGNICTSHAYTDTSSPHTGRRGRPRKIQSGTTPTME